jgi:hypothetical protein
VFNDEDKQLKILRTKINRLEMKNEQTSMKNIAVFNKLWKTKKDQVQMKEACLAETVQFVIAPDYLV